MTRRVRSSPISSCPTRATPSCSTRSTRYGGLDIVVNNAGYAWDGGIHNMSDEQFQAMLDIHLAVPFRLARATVPHFRARAEEDDAV